MTAVPPVCMRLSVPVEFMLDEANHHVAHVVPVELAWHCDCEAVVQSQMRTKHQNTTAEQMTHLPVPLPAFFSFSLSICSSTWMSLSLQGTSHRRDTRRKEASCWHLTSHRYKVRLTAERNLPKSQLILIRLHVYQIFHFWFQKARYRFHLLINKPTYILVSPKQRHVLFLYQQQGDWCIFWRQIKEMTFCNLIWWWPRSSQDTDLLWDVRNLHHNFTFWNKNILIGHNKQINAKKNIEIKLVFTNYKSLLSNLLLWNTQQQCFTWIRIWMSASSAFLYHNLHCPVVNRQFLWFLFKWNDVIAPVLVDKCRKSSQDYTHRTGCSH